MAYDYAQHVQYMLLFSVEVANSNWFQIFLSYTLLFKTSVLMFLFSTIGHFTYMCTSAGQYTVLKYVPFVQAH